MKFEENRATLSYIFGKSHSRSHLARLTIDYWFRCTYLCLPLLFFPVDSLRRLLTSIISLSVAVLYRKSQTSILVLLRYQKKMDLPLCIYPRSIIILTLRDVFCCRYVSYISLRSAIHAPPSDQQF